MLPIQPETSITGRGKNWVRVLKARMKTRDVKETWIAIWPDKKNFFGKPWTPCAFFSSKNEAEIAKDDNNDHAAGLVVITA